MLPNPYQIGQVGPRNAAVLNADQDESDAAVQKRLANFAPFQQSMLDAERQNAPGGIVGSIGFGNGALDAESALESARQQHVRDLALAGLTKAMGGS